MMVTGFLRVFSSAVLLLATTTTFVRQVDALTSATTSATDGDSAATTAPTVGVTSVTSDSDASCQTELTACQGDDVCVACASVIGSTYYDSCIEGVVGGDVETSTSFCTGVAAAPCCIDEITGNECQTSAAFEALAFCIIEAESCDVDDISCSEVLEGTADDDSGAAGSLGHALAGIVFSCAFMAMLPLLWA